MQTMGCSEPNGSLGLEDYSLPVVVVNYIGDKEYKLWLISFLHSESVLQAFSNEGYTHSYVSKPDTVSILFLQQLYSYYKLFVYLWMHMYIHACM